MAVNVKMLARVLYKTATTLQHCDFVLMSKHSNHVKIPVDFPKLKILRVLVYLLIYKFHFNEN